MTSKENKVIETLKFKRLDENKLSFEIIDLSNPEREIPLTSHRHDFYEIILICRGKTKQQKDFKKYLVGKKEILIIPKGSIHQGSFKEKLNGFLVLFTTDFFTKEQHDFISQLEIFNAAYDSDVLKFNTSEWDDIFQLFNSLYQAYKENSPPNKNVLCFLLLAFAGKLNESNSSNYKVASHTSDTVKLFYYLLENNFKEKHQVSFYCSKLNITSKKLTQLLTSVQGKTTLQIINERLMLEAKRELYFTDKIIKEIAIEIGFDDQLHFSKFFKKQASVSPKDFRKRYAKTSI